MIKRKDALVSDAKRKEGNPNLLLKNFTAFENMPEKIKMYAEATLAPGGEIPYHKHEGECEIYFVLSGNATYSDNGVETEIKAGDLTFTPSGESHGIKNNSGKDFKFIPLIVKY